MTTTRVLEDVRVVAIEQFGAGPWATLQLADLGADVIKVEDPVTGGDVSRYVPPFQDGEDSLFFETFNRNKRSVGLDLRRPAGRRAFEDLVRQADVVFSNLRGDVPAKLRIRYADLEHVNPRIVCCSLSGYGMTGPRAAGPGYDYLLQGLAGWMSLTGDPEGPPTKSGLSLVDFAGGFVAASAVLAGLHHAYRHGRGGDFDISLFDTAISLLNYQATWHLTAGYEPTRVRQSGHPSLAPFGNFRTADGWIVLACPKQKFWMRLCQALGHPALAGDPRFADVDSRCAHRDDLTGVLERLLSHRTTDEWLAVFTPLGVPCAPVHTVAQALKDPHTRARGMLTETEHPVFGTVRSVATPVHMAGESSPRHVRAPRRGEHTEEVLRFLGYDDEAIARVALEGSRARPTDGVGTTWTSS